MDRYFRVCAPADKIPFVRDLLNAQGFESSGLSFWEKAFKLEVSPFSLGNSLASFFGLIYIQDISSMLPPLPLEPQSGDFVLDLCASPGSKTGILADLTGFEGGVLANEPTPSRLSVLRRNLQHQGVMNAASSGFRGEKIPLPQDSVEAVLLDVPCSGWGTEAKNPGIREFWREDKLDALLSVQRGLLSSAARLLAPGGRLVYSTCTTNPGENEEQMQWAVDHLGLRAVKAPRPLGLSVLSAPGFSSAYRTEAVRGEGQGFFVALLQKPGEGEVVPSGRPVRSGCPCGPKALDFLREKGEIYQVKDKVFRIPGPLRDMRVNFSLQGAYLGKAKKKGYQFAPRLRGLIPGEPDEREAVVFEDAKELEGLVRGKSLAAPINSGACPIYWKKLPLGWARAKNGRLLWTEK